MAPSPLRVISSNVRRSSLLFLYPLTWLLLFLNKIPLINKLISLYSKFYGKSKLFRALVLLRKVFICINALIGVYAVFSLTGFSSDNIIAGFIGMGYQYVEILSNNKQSRYLPIPILPKIGDLDLNKIVFSKYFLS